MHAVIVREMVDPDHIEESKAPLGRSFLECSSRPVSFPRPG
jgi:hypothetical protein